MLVRLVAITIAIEPHGEMQRGTQSGNKEEWNEQELTSLRKLDDSLGRIDGVSYRRHVLSTEKMKTAMPTQKQAKSKSINPPFLAVCSFSHNAKWDLRWSTTSIPVIPADWVLFTKD